MAARPTQRLALALATGRAEDVLQVLDSGVEVDTLLPFGGTALLFAAKSGHVEVVKVLLDAKADVRKKDESGATALHRAAESGHGEIVSALLDNGAAIDEKMYDDTTALACAATSSRFGVVKLLLERGASIDDKIAYTVFELAIRNNDLATMELLIDNDMSVNVQDEETGTTPLMHAVTCTMFPKHKLIRMLLEAGACPNTQDKAGCSAFMHIVSKEHINEITETLIEFGADVNQTDGAGLTALMRVIMSFSEINDFIWEHEGKVEVIRMLLSKGAEPDKRSTCSFYGGAGPVTVTALWCAVKKELGSVATILMEAGADANFANEIDGNTVLMLAVKNRDSVCVKALLKFGCDVHKVNRDGHTALQMAEINRGMYDPQTLEAFGYGRIIELLEEYGARQ